MSEKNNTLTQSTHFPLPNPEYENMKAQTHKETAAKIRLTAGEHSKFAMTRLFCPSNNHLLACEHTEFNKHTTHNLYRLGHPFIIHATVAADC